MINEKVPFLTRIHQSLSKVRKVNTWYVAPAIILLLFLLINSGLAKNESKLQNLAGAPQSTPNVIPSPTPIATPTPEPNPSPTTKPTDAPTPTPTTLAPIPTESPYVVFSKIGREVTENSNLNVFENKDRTIDVYNIIENEPEGVWESGFEASERQWITEFLSKVYTSNYRVRYVQISVTWLNAGVPPTKVGLGINQARNISKDEWNNVTPYDLCTWLKSVSTFLNENDYASSTFTENYECS
jgi:hypothetical protein